MDGVPGLTQDAVQPEGSFDYLFALPEAGTFRYHSHSRSFEQVARGLYGPLIVEEHTPPDVDHEISVMIDDWRLEETGPLIKDLGSIHDAAPLGNFAKAIITPRVALRPFQRILLRLMNVSGARMFPIKLRSIEGILPVDSGTISDLLLAPAQRVDIIADVQDTDRVSVIVPSGQGPYDMRHLPVSGPTVPAREDDFSSLAVNRMVEPVLDAAFPVPLVMQGAAMSSQVSQDSIGLWNGNPEQPDAPPQRFRRDETARIMLQNETRFPRGIHLRRHHFHEVTPTVALGHYRHVGGHGGKITGY